MEKMPVDEAKNKILKRGYLNKVTITGSLDLSREEFDTLDLAGSVVEGDLVLIGSQINNLYLMCATVKGDVYLDGACVGLANLRGITIVGTLYKGWMDDEKLFIDIGVSINEIK